MWKILSVALARGRLKPWTQTWPDHSPHYLPGKQRTEFSFTIIIIGHCNILFVNCNFMQCTDAIQSYQPNGHVKGHIHIDLLYLHDRTCMMQF